MHVSGMVKNDYSRLVYSCIAMSETEEDVQKKNSPAILYVVKESYSIVYVFFFDEKVYVI